MMTRRRFAALVVLVGCGDDGGGGVPPDAPPPDADTTLCSGKPCLTSIDDEIDWMAVDLAYTGERCDFLADTKYVMPATATAALQEIVFQDVEVHRYHYDFMTQALAEIFGGLSPQMYQAMVQRRATREYWAGALFRIVDSEGVTLGYGFDVIVDPALWEEQLTEEEVAAIEAQLETRFHLPLVYAPTTWEAIYAAHGFTGVTSHFPRACHHVTCETPGVDCVEVPEAISLCGHFMEGRTIDVEHVRKAMLAATPGVYDLPRGVGTYGVPRIFGGGELGPSRTPIVPAGPNATYRVTEQGGYTSHTYEQSFVAGAQTLDLTWNLYLPQGGGGFLLQTPYADEQVWTHAELAQSSMYEDVITFGSCSDQMFDHWRITGALPAGDGFTIDFRYTPPGGGSGPLFPVRGEVTLGGTTATVTDYFDLVYAGEHHNWNNQYWVLFDAPIQYMGHPVYGLWIDEVAYQFEIEAAYTLGAALQPLDTLTVTGYEVAEVQ